MLTTIAWATLVTLADQPVELAIRPPEIVGITHWLNSDPLTLKQLKGKVVVAHFFTTGCINCIRNYPHVKAWAKDFKDQNVVILGIHTPEFESEADVEAIKKKLKKNGITFPVAIDNDLKLWNRWGNRVWPCTYIIDKAGVCRYRWDGEYNFRGKDGEALLREKIKTLLNESK